MQIPVPREMTEVVRCPQGVCGTPGTLHTLGCGGLRMGEEIMGKLEGMGKARIPGIASEEVASPFTFSVKVNGTQGGPSGCTRSQPPIHHSPFNYKAS